MKQCTVFIVSVEDKEDENSKKTRYRSIHRRLFEDVRMVWQGKTD